MMLFVYFFLFAFSTVVLGFFLPFMLPFVVAFSSDVALSLSSLRKCPCAPCQFGFRLGSVSLLSSMLAADISSILLSHCQISGTSLASGIYPQYFEA